LVYSQFYHVISNPKAYFGDEYEKMLERTDIDAVDIVLPIDMLLPSIEAALKKGKHVISEKPVAPSVQEGLDFISKYEAEYKPKGLIWAIAENYFYEPAGVCIRSIRKHVSIRSPAAVYCTQH
jgi:predicted dehydrogenase